MSEQHTTQQTTQKAKNYEPLKFTGNWFIDAGILGFVNLMEEVYGWDLYKLKDKIKKEPDKVYYGYFPFAYFYKLSNNKDHKVINHAVKFIESSSLNKYELLKEIWWKYILELFREKWINSKIKEIYASECYDNNGKIKAKCYDDEYVRLIQEIKDLLDIIVNDFEEILKNIFNKKKELKDKESGKHKLSLEDLKVLKDNINKISDKQATHKLKRLFSMLDELDRYLNEIWSKLKRREIIIKDKKHSVFCRLPIDSSFFKNYLFFNISRGIIDQLEDLTNLIEGNTSYSEYLSKIDKAINKFLPSDNEFPNIHYTKFYANDLVEEVPFLFVYLINFLNAFIEIRGIRLKENMFVYSNDLDFTYKVNKKIKLYIKIARDKKEISLFRITWQAVVETLIEIQSMWSIENMYLIRYEELSQQNLIGVEYIGIPKLQASLLLHSNMVEILNREIIVKVKDNKNKVETKWLLEEFIKNRALLPYLIENFKIYLNSEKNNTSHFLRGKNLIYLSLIDAKVKEFRSNDKIFGNSYLYTIYKNLVDEIKAEFKNGYKASYIFMREINEEHDKSYLFMLLNAIKLNRKEKFINLVLKKILNSSNNESKNSIIQYIFSKILDNDTTWQNYALIILAQSLGGEVYGEND